MSLRGVANDDEVIPFPKFIRRLKLGGGAGGISIK